MRVGTTPLSLARWTDRPSHACYTFRFSREDQAVFTFCSDYRLSTSAFLTFLNRTHFSSFLQRGRRACMRCLVPLLDRPNVPIGTRQDPPCGGPPTITFSTPVCLAFFLVLRCLGTLVAPLSPVQKLSGPAPPSSLPMTRSCWPPFSRAVSPTPLKTLFCFLLFLLPPPLAL